MQDKKHLILVVVSIAAIFSVGFLPALAADTLTPSDFNEESWWKVIDFYDYARTNAASHGKTPPSASSHANLYLTYVNTRGIQVMYGGLVNITDGARTVTLPIQSWMMHYKSKNGSKDLVTAASFIMLMAFAENQTTKHVDSPDKNDTLFASFNLGFDLTNKFGSETPPRLASKTEIIPLTSSADKLNWHWGMKYTNLTAIWWRTNIDPQNPSHEFIAVSRYDELTFTYDLTLDPEDGTATLTANYIIGKITDLWVFGFGLFGLVFPGLFSVHYNSTGGYWLNGHFKVDPLNVYQFLWQKGIKMSIVQFQSTVILDHTASFESDGTAVNNTEAFVDNSNITTTADDGEEIFNADFATKRTYNLYNYTEDPTETQFDTYNTTTRTAKVGGLADNPVFYIHTGLMRYIPLVLANMDPALYEKAKDHLLDMTYADYFYIIGYPTYSGYRIEHDPTYTAYFNATAAATTPLNIGGAILLIAIIAAVAAGTVLLLKKRRAKNTQNTQVSNVPPPPPPTTTP